MRNQFKVLLCSGLLLMPYKLVIAETLQDVNTDVEDVTLESDAAIAQSKEAQTRVANEREEAKRAMHSANRARNAAATKEQKAIDQMKRSEAEYQSLTEQQNKLKLEINKMNADTEATEKATAESTARTETAHGELVALQQLKNEESAKLMNLNSEKDKALIAMQDMDDQKAMAEKEFQQLKNQEKSAQDEHDATLTEEAQKKAKLDIHLAELKESYKQIQDHTALLIAERAQAQRNTLKLEEQAKIGEAEIRQAQQTQQAVIARPMPTSGRQVDSVKLADAGSSVVPGSVSADAEMTLKRDCKIFDRPTKGPKVLGVQYEGTSVRKSEEGKSWVAFPMADGQKGFVAKSCF